MKKKTAIILLTAVLALSLAACGSDNSGNGAETTAAVSDDTAESTSGEDSSSSSSESPSESENELKDIAEAIQNAYGEDYIPNLELTEEFISETFELESGEYFSTMYGLDPETYDDIFAQNSMIGTYPDTLILVHAVSGRSGDVKDALSAYRDRLINDSMQYPMNQAKVNASQVVQSGDCVAFILLGKIDEREDIDESEAASFAEEQTQIGVDAFKKAAEN